MIKKSLFEKDFIAAEERFPKLQYVWNKALNSWIITGELDICDVKGVYWNTFDILILVPKGYPYCVPELIEKSKIIPRDIEWHISPEGICCYDVENSRLAMSKTGINLSKFITEKIYTYFANQLFKLAEKKYAGQEYAHHLAGIIQYYMEEHHLKNEESVIVLLQSIIKKTSIDRNDKCPCGSNRKVKHCHQNSIDVIKTLGSEKISKDLSNITQHIRSL